MSKILITGGCGFVGSSLCLLLKKKYPSYQIISLDNLHRSGSELNIQRLRDAGVTFVHGDIRNREDLALVDGFDVLIEAAAEPSVMAGIGGNVDYLINTNLNGTLNCLQEAFKYKASVIFLSTSRVYPIGNIEKIETFESDSRFEIAEGQTLPGISVHGISEHFPLTGSRSFYGATKLASELFVQEYADMLGLQAVINRCGVLTGPWQMGKQDQGVIVLWMARHYWKGKLGYFGYGGTGKQVRDFLHINDLFRLLDLQIHNIKEFTGQTFNVGGGREVSTSLQELTGYCQELTGNQIEINCVPENRAADIKLYITDNQLITEKTGWKPEILVQETLADIYDWLNTNNKILKPILN